LIVFVIHVLFQLNRELKNMFGVQNGKRANPFGHRKLKRKIGGGGFIKM